MLGCFIAVDLGNPLRLTPQNSPWAVACARAPGPPSVWIKADGTIVESPVGFITHTYRPLHDLRTNVNQYIAAAQADRR